MQMSEMSNMSGNRLNLPTLPRFSGLADEDANAWLAKFKMYMEIDNYENHDACVIVFAYLDDVAFQWYQALDESIRNDLVALKSAFTERFVRCVPRWLMEQTFASRKQGQMESINTYVTSLRRLCSQLGKSDNDLLEKFILGLRPSLKRYVIGQNPSSMKQAETLARLGESLEEMMPESDAVLHDTILQAVDQLLSSVAIIQEDLQELQAEREYITPVNFQKYKGSQLNN